MFWLIVVHLLAFSIACEPNSSSYPDCLIDSLTLDEKVSLLGTSSPGVGRLGIPAYKWWNEGLHGIGNTDGSDLSSHPATSYPQVIGTSASFNRSLWFSIGRSVGREGRGLRNAGNFSGLTFWAPNINLLKDPRWGRGQETPGEDPLLTSEYAMSYVSGIQERRGDFLLASACCKHFYDHNLEFSSGIDRFHFDAHPLDIDLADSFLPAFETCVKRAKASCVMCAYSAVNGVPNCANKDTLTGKVRNDWKLDGYVTGDCGAVDNVRDTHHFTRSDQETVKVVLEAGLDIDCGDFIQKAGKSAVLEGFVDVSFVDRAVKRLLNVQHSLGILGHTDVFDDIKYVGPNRQLAMEAAEQSFVLLQNNNSVLPIVGCEKKFLVLGPHANSTIDMLGNYYGTTLPITSPLSALSSSRCGTGKVRYIECDGINCWYDSAFIDKVKIQLEDVEAVFLFLGINQEIEAEMRDRTHLKLPGMQEDLLIMIREIVGKRSIVTILFSGGPVDTEKVTLLSDAVLWAGYPGEMGGQAIASVLTGRSYSPSGRLPWSVYRNLEFCENESMLESSLRPGTRNNRPSKGRTYRFYQGHVHFPFGFGISFVKFRTDIVRYSFKSDIFEISVNVTNTENQSENQIYLTSYYTLTLFAETSEREWWDPNVWLVGFNKTGLLFPGQSEVVEIKIPSDNLKLYDFGGKLKKFRSNQICLKKEIIENECFLVVDLQPEVISRII